MSRQPGCVVIGSGPSLAGVEMHDLVGVDSVAFNRSYVAWPRWGFAPTYYCCFDRVGLAQDAAQLKTVLSEYSSTRAYLNDNAGALGFVPSDRIAFVTASEGTEFRIDLRTVSDFGNVGASSLQILAALGYRRVVLIGVDGRYLPISTQADAQRNYFTSEYVAAGHRMLAFDDETSRRQWDTAALGCRDAGVHVVNASPGSAVDCFPKSNLATALAWLRGDDADGVSLNG